MKRNDNALERSVRSVLYTGAITAFAVSPMAMAQQEGDGEEDEDQLELGRQVVTGSRIKRIDLEDARPVIVITREEIELSGQESVADVLRNSPVNTFGSTRETSGTSWGGQATINLHGIGATRSLVLLDGRRAPRSPVTSNQVNDLNIIPLAAVDRIEILTDSASAIYGSDAIGGVINIILRKDYDGAELGGSVIRPTREGGDQDAGVITLGGSTSRGRFLFSADFYSKRHLASADRDYTSSDNGYDAGAVDAPLAPFEGTYYDFGNTNNISVNGNTINAPDVFPGFGTVGRWLAVPNCEQVVNPETGERVYVGPYDLGLSGWFSACGFDYAALSWETTDIKRLGTFLHADYEISPDHALRLQSVYSGLDSNGRYAPALSAPPLSLNITEAAAAGIKENFDYDVPYPHLLPYQLRHRFVGLGNRDFRFTNTVFENALMAYGTVGMFDYEFEVRHTRYDSRENSCCYAKKVSTETLMAEGRYNPFDPLSPANESAYDLIKASATRDSRGSLRSYSGNVTFDLFDAPGGPVGWAVGFEYFDEDFRDIYDPLSSGGDLIGSAGNSAAGSRSIKAGFVEALIPIRSDLEVSAAVRWDSYDDSAGSELSAYLSARYQPTDWLLFRGSWGEGFRAPNLNNLYGARSFGAIEATDYTGCAIAGIPEDQCLAIEYATFSSGNQQLLPELSDSLNFGFVVDWEPITVRMDYWDIQIKDGIGVTTLNSLLFLEERGECQDTGRVEERGGVPARVIQCSPGNVIYRSEGGTLLEADVGWGNTSRAEYTGIDLYLDYDLETATAGDFDFSVLGTRVLRSRFQNELTEGWISSLGEAGLSSAEPKLRGVGVIRWNYRDHTVIGYIRYIHGYVRPEREFEAPSHTEYDLLYQWRTPWDGRITIGVRNLTDEDPELDPHLSQSPALYSLYSLDGRQPYVGYRHFF